MPANLAPRRKPINVRQLFDKLDTNHDGVLSFDEAKVALQGKVPPPQYRAVFDKFDADSNGVLDLKEFIALCRLLDGAALSASGPLKRKASVIDIAWEAAQPPRAAKKPAKGPKPINVKQLFDKLDKNHDGVLSFEEAKVALQGKVPPPQFRAVFDKFDADSNGVLDLKEFISLCRLLDGAALSATGPLQRKASVIDVAWEAAQPPKKPLKGPKPINVAQLFEKLDTNQDGVLSFDEAKVALQGKVPPPQFRAVFDKFDADSNGVLDLKEFIALCRMLDGASLSISGPLQRKSSVIDVAWEAAQPQRPAAGAPAIRPNSRKGSGPSPAPSPRGVPGWWAQPEAQSFKTSATLKDLEGRLGALGLRTGATARPAANGGTAQGAAVAKAAATKAAAATLNASEAALLAGLPELHQVTQKVSAALQSGAQAKEVARLEALLDELGPKAAHHATAVGNDNVPPVRRASSIKLLETASGAVSDAALAVAEARKRAETTSRRSAKLRKWSMKELSELKAMVNPPKPVQAVVEALGIVLLGQRMPWAAGGKHMLMDKSGVVARLMNATPESLPADRVAKLRAMIRNTPELDLEAIAACSKAAAGIGEWLHALAEAAPHPLHAARRVPRTVGPIC